MKHTEFKLESTDMRELHAERWEPETEPKAVVCIIHGLGEHIGRWKHVAEFLADNGYAVVAFDHFGHGKSPGKKGHANYDSILLAIDDLLIECNNFYKGKPRFLYGHSMGGNLVINYQMRYSQMIHGVIASSPWLRLSFDPPKKKLALAKFMAGFYPKWSEPSEIDAEFVSRIPEEVKAYKNDPLNHAKISAGLFFGTYDAGFFALRNTQKFHCPLLLMHGTGDNLTSYKASEEFAEMLGDKATLKLFDGGYHELHNDLCRAEVLQTVKDWLDTQMQDLWHPDKALKKEE